MRYCFVILHFKVAIVTIECIKKIYKQCGKNDIKIILVDNHSDNGSLEQIKDEFLQYKNIEYVMIERNVGFAKGNNIGFLLAKHKYNADFVIVMNNDVFIEQALFCEMIKQIYEESNFDLLGPDIITRNGLHQNPLHDCIISKRRLTKAIWLTRTKLFLMPLYNIRLKIKIEESIGNENYSSEQTDVPLHGSCIIFSKNYTGKHEFAFYPNTFLYAEEDILYYLCKKEKLKLLYSPKLNVFHNEDVSTNTLCKTNKAKRIFQLKNSLRSLLIYKELIKNGD